MARDSIIQIRSKFYSGQEPDLVRLVQYLKEISSFTWKEEQNG